MFVIVEATTGRKYCNNLHRQIWKVIDGEVDDISFFAEKSSDMYSINTFPTLEKAQARLNQIKNDRAIELPFKTDDEMWENFCIISPLFDESEIHNPKLEIHKLESKPVK